MTKKGSSIARQKGSENAVDRLIDLTECIRYLEKAVCLVRVRSAVSSKFELAGIAKQFEGKKCVLFERVKASRYPVFIGMLWNRDTIGELFGISKDKIPFVIAKAIGDWRQKKDKLPSPIVSKGPANEVIEKDVNLYKLPIPIHALKDGGRYFDSSVVVVKNPKTGVPNTSIHRLMVTKKDRLTFLIDPDRHLGDFLDIAERRNKPLQLTINNGVGIVPWLVSTLPKQGDGKFEIANHILGKPIKMIKAQKVDAPAYAAAQFVIEAEIIPHKREMEGPFAEVTGYYASRNRRWVMRVLAITHRRIPVFHSLLSGQEVWNAVGFTAEAKIFATVRKKVPQLKAVYLDYGGCGFYGAVIQVNKNKTGIGKKAIKETFNVFQSLQRVVAVDTDVNLYDPNDVNWAITTRFNPDRDLVILENQVGHILNPMVKINPDGKGGTVTKMGLDATAPYPKTRNFERVKFRDVNLEDYEIVESALR